MCNAKLDIIWIVEHVQHVGKIVWLVSLQPIAQHAS